MKSISMLALAGIAVVICLCHAHWIAAGYRFRNDRWYWQQLAANRVGCLIAGLLCAYVFIRIFNL